MLRYLIRRLLQMIVVLLGIALLVFSLLHLVPGDPAAVLLGQQATAQDIARLRLALGLDRPLWTSLSSTPAGLCAATSGRRSPSAGSV